MSTLKTLKRTLPRVFLVIQMEMRGYAKGQASEGYAGGYMDALMDVDAILRGISPSDKWGFWRSTLERDAKATINAKHAAMCRAALQEQP